MKTIGLLASGLLFLMTAAMADDAPKVPEGYVLQLLEPTGGRIFRPDGWHYAEAHRESVFKWIVSKEDPRKGPYHTGVMLQAFVGIQKATGKTPEDFGKMFLESRAKLADKVIRKFPDVEMGLFERAGIEVLETFERGGKKVRHHVVYSVFWMKASDVGAVMSAGCPANEWDDHKARFDIMGEVELIDMSRFVGDGGLKPAARLPKKEEVARVIESLLAKPGDKRAGNNVGKIVVFSRQSPEVRVDLNVEYLPWMGWERDLENGNLLLGAFVGGNILPQLKKGVKEDHPKAGLLAMLRVYAILRKQDAMESIEELDRWAAMNEEQLDRFIKEVAERAEAPDE